MLFYSYLTQRRDSAQFIGQFVNHQLMAVLAYTSELSFPAFSFYCANNQQVYFHELITFTRTTLQLDEHVICGTILCDHDLQLFQSYGLITGNPQRFLTMKHVDQAKLLENNRATRIKEEEYSEAIDFIRKGGMRFFTRSEIKGCPFLGIKDGRDFVAVGGFHFYDRQLVEIGNIITKPEYRGRGLGKLLTSQLTWMGKQLSADVYLGVMKENQPAVHVYESLGFETTAELSIVDFTLSCHEFTSKS